MGQDVLNELLAELVNHLPEKLRQGVRQDVLRNAMEQGYLSVTPEYKLTWMHESKTLLAYFCGRMWCGDSSHYSCEAHTHIWDRAMKKMFPEKDLTVLFGERNLRTLRKNRDLCPLPEGWQEIESFFRLV